MFTYLLRIALGTVSSNPLRPPKKNPPLWLYVLRIALRNCEFKPPPTAKKKEIDHLLNSAKHLNHKNQSLELTKKMQKNQGPGHPQELTAGDLDPVTKPSPSDLTAPTRGPVRGGAVNDEGFILPGAQTRQATTEPARQMYFVYIYSHINMGCCRLGTPLQIFRA